AMVQPGQIYSLSDFIGERNRIDGILKNQGYFYFSPDYLVFDADTSVGQQNIDVKLNLKKDMPPDARVPYFMDRIIVFDDYSLRDYHPDTVSIDNYLYVSNSHQLKPRTILNAVFLEKDSLYSRANHYNTLSHLMGLGVYKYANARFNKDGSTNSLMNAGIYLTPLKKMSLSAEMSASVKTNNYAGPGLKLSFKNRNLFRGAEMLNINLGGRFETQFSGDNVGETSYEITLDGSLTFPRFVPIRFGRKASRQYVPNTIISMGGGLFSRIRLYELHSFNVSLGYTWRTNERVSHLFSPVDVSFTNLAKSSREFEDYLNENPNIRKSFEEQFIIGSSYTFTYSNLHLQTNPTNFYISQMIDLAGNTASAITTALQGSPPSESKQHTLLGVPYSQFVRLRNEMRFFINLKGQNQLGLRLITAGGIPYGNSSVMPYIKQFFVGGTNSVRAFRARTVGPGTYFPSDSLNSIYVDQSGDIKLETSIEYRFPIYGFFKGALFADAGNIWLVNEDKQRPGGEFDIQTFYKQLAVGAGLGFRFDFSFVVIRLDIAFPLRKPNLPEGERWVFKEIQLGSPLWRKQNLVYNVAIGYPF
nr:BamA/TamA family outer membrane protein [Bacteroidota bacterium]